MRAFTVAAAAAMLIACGTNAESAEKYAAMFYRFKAQYNRKYAGAAEEAMRFKTFAANMEKAEEMQARNPLATFGMNEFADHTTEEFKTKHNADSHFAAVAAKHTPNVAKPEELRAAAGKAIDWRTKGAVTAVKNQGQCGSCWSFSTTGNIEGQWALAGNTLVALSEQELVSCDHTDSGCQGGLMDNAFRWLVSNKAGWITSEAEYPYVSGGGSVPSCTSGKPNVAQIYGHQDIGKNEDDMAAYSYAHGPVSIGVDATSWQSYTGGILTDCISKQVDHGVLIVGFDDAHSPPYWIIKNSWAASWGESGYIRVQKGTNQCLVTTAPSSSLVHKSGPTPPSPPATPAPYAPSTPAPYTPPTPPSPPSTGTFSQYVCDDMMCLVGCQKHTIKTGTCLQTSETSSAIVTCGNTTLNVETFSTGSCSGAGSRTTQPLNECLEDTQGSYIYDVCGEQASQVSDRTFTLAKN